MSSVEALAAVLGDALGSAPIEAAPLSGGSINAAWAVTLADGRRLFVKTNPRAPAGMFAAEAHGLEFLRAGIDAQLRTPEIVAVGADFLVLELLEPGEPCADFDERLGRGLAAMHRSGSALSGFGLDRDNWIGSEPQPNASRPDWPSFYRTQRLEPMLARAGRLIDTELWAGFDALFDRLDALCGPAEPPARLHGDLWGGNLHRDREGVPVLIDPAVYAGHREVDLAMMRLFGGFSSRVFAAYEEAWPLAEGWQRRVDLYQLYPLLVHVVLFGAGYVGQLAAALRRLS